MIKHKNLSIFVPHEGCPNQCSFCDQKKISGTQNPPTPQEVERLCDEFLPHTKEEGEKIGFSDGRKPPKSDRTNLLLTKQEFDRIGGIFKYWYNQPDFNRATNGVENTFVVTFAPARVNAFALSYSQFVPGNTGMNTFGAAILWLQITMFFAS